MAGRRTKMTVETVKKLEEAFAKGLSDAEACLFADISKQTLYNYQKKRPAFLDRKELLKDNLKMQAKLNLAEKIEGEHDMALSLWYLERKCKDEFTPRQEVGFGADRPFRVEIEVMGDEAADQPEAESVSGDGSG